MTRPLAQLATCRAQGTNGMVYLQAILDLPALDADELDLLPLLCACLSEVGSAGRDYRATQARQAAVTGGLSARANVRGGVDDVRQVKGVLVVAGKALARNQAAPGRTALQTSSERRWTNCCACANWSRNCAPSARKALPIVLSSLAVRPLRPPASARWPHLISAGRAWRACSGSRRWMTPWTMPARWPPSPGD